MSTDLFLLRCGWFCGKHARVFDWCCARFHGNPARSRVFFTVAFLTGSLGILAVIAGAIMLVRETRFSFQVLREEKSFLSERVRGRLANLTGSLTQARQNN